MKTQASTLLATALLVAAPACGATGRVGAGTAYSLYEGAVKFSAPASWPAIMQKAEGTPQFVAFLVKNPADPGSGEAGRVSLEARLLDDAGAFPALVRAAIDKAKQSPGYEARTDGGGTNALHYVALDGKQRYEYREAWYLGSKTLIHVRCAQPLLAGTTADWTAAYEAGCTEVMDSAKPR